MNITNKNRNRNINEFFYTFQVIILFFVEKYNNCSQIL
jgi:hypothetical protein